MKGAVRVAPEINLNEAFWRLDGLNLSDARRRIEGVLVQNLAGRDEGELWRVHIVSAFLGVR
jgi:hypothetical protein